MCMFFIRFSSSCKQNLVFFPLCVLCVVLIFECILLQCEFAKDIISLDFSPFFVYFIFPELWPILFRKLEINGEFDIMLIFHISIVNIIFILFPEFEFTV